MNSTVTDETKRAENPYGLGKKISTETKRLKPNSRDSRWIGLGGIVSQIQFDPPISDGSGKTHESVFLSVVYTRGHPGSWEWWMKLQEQPAGYCIGWGERLFGSLNENFCDYSEERLKSWQELALRAHDKALAAIKDVYFSGEHLSDSVIMR